MFSVGDSVVVIDPSGAATSKPMLRAGDRGIVEEAGGGHLGVRLTSGYYAGGYVEMLRWRFKRCGCLMSEDKE